MTRMIQFIAAAALSIITVCTYASAPKNTVLITGANRGLGLEFAKQYQQQGYHVIATARRPEQAIQLNKLGVQVERLDVTQHTDLNTLVHKLSGQPIDILINNAGLMDDNRTATIGGINLNRVSKLFEVNALGPLRVTQALLPNLRAGQQKKVINISSRLGSIANNTGGMFGYRASKAALNQLNKNMSIDLGKEGFTCIALHPGWVRTDMGGQSATLSPQESISIIIKLIDNLSRQDNGRYIDLHGKTLPW